MHEPIRAEPQAATAGPQPVVVKKYANRRLYNTESSSYITLENLADMVRQGRDFVVYDAKSSEDITRGVLTQIIVEEESKGRSLLPTGFLRQLIGFYGGNMQTLVPKYLEQALTTFSHQQEQMRKAMQQTIGPFFPFGIEEVSRQNMAMIERAMTLFTPFYRGQGGAGRFGEPAVTGTSADVAPAEPDADAPADHPNPEHAHIAVLEAEIETLRRELQRARHAGADADAATNGDGSSTQAGLHVEHEHGA